MTEADLPRVFSEVVYDLLGEVFPARGIDVLYEDEVESIVRECVDRYYAQSVVEWYVMQGIPPTQIPSVQMAMSAIHNIGLGGRGR